MLRAHGRSWGLAAVLACVWAVSGCEGVGLAPLEPGSFSIAFVWDPLPEEPVQVWVRVEDRSSSEPGDWSILASAGPELFTPGGELALELEGVSNGAGRVVVVEAREGPSTGLRVLYYGLSEPFEIEPGEDTTVEVPVAFQQPETELHGASVVLVFGGEVAPTIIGGTSAESAVVRTRSIGAVEVVLANDPSFSANLETRAVDPAAPQCSEEEDPEGLVWTVCDHEGWSLLAEVEDLGDTTYSVYARFVDQYGYESPVGKASVFLDRSGPVVLSASVSPPAAKLGETVTVALNLNEVLAGATLSVTPEAGAPAFAGPVQAGKSTTFTWEAIVGAKSDGQEFAFSATLSDTLGNETQWTPNEEEPGSATLVVDASPPDLVDAPSINALAFAEGDDVVVELVVDEELAVDPTVTVGGLELALDPGGPEPPAWRFVGEVVAAEGDGLKPVVITLEDAAGNRTVLDDAIGAVSFDFAPPALVSTSASPELGKLGATLVWQINVDEPLGATPTLHVEPPLDLGEASPSGNVWTWTHTIGEQDSEGPYLCTVDLVDLVGNEAEGLEGAAFAIDPTAPLVNDVLLTTSNEAPGVVREGDIVDVLFEVSEELAQDPVVTLGTAPLGLVSGPSPYVYALTISKGMPDAGTRPLGIAVVDPAGNGSTSEHGTLLVDFAAPALVAAGATPEVAGAEAELIYQISTSEPLGSPPELLTDPPLEVGEASGAETVWSWSLPIAGVTAEGDYGAHVTVADVAGNMETHDAPGFVVDTTPLELLESSVTSTNATEGVAASGDVVSVSLLLDEPAFSDPKVTVGGKAAPIAASDGGWYLFEYPVSDAGDTDGPKAVGAAASDEAGNPLSMDLGIIRFDFEAPEILSTEAAPEPAGIGDLLTYLVSTNEVLAAPPELTVVGGPDLGDPTASGAGWLWSFEVPAGVGDGTFAIALDLVDEAGNAAEGVDGGTITLDGTLPEILEASASSTNPGPGSAGPGSAKSYARKGDTITVTFTTSEPVPEVAVVLGTYELTRQDDDGQPFVFALELLEDEGLEGELVPEIAVADAAGNAATAVADPIHVDLTPPSVLAGGPSKALYGASESVVITLTASEELAAPPLLTVLPSFLDLGEPSQDGNTYSWTQEPSPLIPGGSYALQVELVDLAGNVLLLEDLGELALDDVAPVVQELTVQPSSLAHGATLSVSFDVLEAFAPGPDPVVTFGAGDAGAMSKAEPAAEGFAFTYTLLIDQALHSEGLKNVVVQAADQAGNLGFAAASATVDFAPPELLSGEPSKAVYGPGQVVTYALTFSEPLSELPSVVASLDGVPAEGFLTVEDATLPRADFTLLSVPVEASHEGLWEVAVTATDEAGNSSPMPAVGAVFQVDATAPLVVDLEATPGRVSLMPGHDTIAISFGLPDDELGGEGASQGSYSVSAGGEAVSCAEEGPGSGLYACTHTVEQGSAEGVNAIVVTALDAAQNLTTASTSVVYDFTVPLVTAAGPDKPSYAFGQTLTYTVDVSEQLGAPPELTVRRDGEPVPGFFAPAIFLTETRWQVSREIEGVSDGTYTVDVLPTDVAGNTPAEPTQGQGFEVDTGIPQSNPAIDPQDTPGLTKVRSNGVVTVSGSYDEDTSLVSATLLPLDADGEVLQGTGCGLDVTGAIGLSSGTFTGQFSVGAPCEGATAVALVVIVANEAGTESEAAASRSQPLTLDDAAPVDLAATVAPVPFTKPGWTKLGTLGLVLQATESDGSPVQVHVDGNVLDTASTFEWVALPGEGETLPVELIPGDGSKALSVGFRDELGNESVPLSVVVILDTNPPSSMDSTKLMLIEQSPAPYNPSQVADELNEFSVESDPGGFVNADRVLFYAVPNDAVFQAPADQDLGAGLLTVQSDIDGAVQEVPLKADGGLSRVVLPYNGGEYYVTPIDAAGNPSTNSLLQVPAFTEITIVPAVIGLGGSATIDFDVSSLLQGATVGLGTGSKKASASLISETSSHLQLQYDDSGGQVAGYQSVVVRIDGDSIYTANSFGTDAALVTVDYSAPELDLAKVVVQESPPGLADVIEGLAGAVVDLAGPDLVRGGGVELLAVSVEVIGDTTGSVYGTVAVAADGSFPAVEIGVNFEDSVTLRVTDQAGNTTEVGFDNDIDAPLISSLLVVPSEARSGEDLDITFEVQDDAHDLLELPVVTATTAGRLATHVSGSLTTNLTTEAFVYDFVVDGSEDSEGAQTLTVTATDLVGNSAQATFALTFDFQPPTSTLGAPAGPTFWNGQGMSGDASDEGVGVALVEVAFQDDGSELWLGPAQAVFDSDVAVWHEAAGAAEWSFAFLSGPPMAQGQGVRLWWRATDDVGNVEPAQGPALRQYDGTPPETTELLPWGTDVMEPGDVTFEFYCTDDSGSCTFECRLDGEAFAPCESPKTYTDAPAGDRAFTVRAVDEAGNVDPSPQTFEWLQLWSWVGVSRGLGGHTCGLTHEGRVACWGLNSSGQLGLGHIDSRALPNQLDAEGPFAEVAAGTSHTCALTETGDAWCWGSDSYGQLGRPAGAEDEVPGPTTAAGPFEKLALGDRHTCALHSDQSIWCWGDNSSGQLFRGELYGSSEPQAAVAGPWVDVAAGAYFTCAIKGDGSLWCAGEGSDGQLGYGVAQDSATLVQAGAESDFVRVAAGGEHVCALNASDELWCWGNNGSGQLGLGDTSIRVTPSKVVMAAMAGFGEFTLGTDHTCAMGLAGKHWCWGSNEWGQAGLPDDTSGATSHALSTPGEAWMALGGGAEVTCGLRGDGTLACFGGSEHGALGDGALHPLSLPPEPTLNGFASIALSDHHACGVGTGGALSCWGRNDTAQLGIGSASKGTSSGSPSPIAGPSTSWASVSVTHASNGSVEGHSCAIDSGGKLYCWGDTSWGKLGTGFGDDGLAPTQVTVSVPTASTWLAVSTAAQSSCAIDAGHRLYCWGNDKDGQTGQGTNSGDLNTPHQVGTDEDWQALTSGSFHHCGIRGANPGLLLCWGNNANGGLGNGTTLAKDQPTLVSGSYDWSKVDAGHAYTCGLTTGGEVYCWGHSSYGKLGNGETGNRFLPTLVSEAGPWIDVGASVSHACARHESDGHWWCWGDNSEGQLGTGSGLEDNYNPAPIVGETPWETLAIGGDTTCGITASGEVGCWGSGANGQLGTGSLGFSSAPQDVQRYSE